ncbi:DUF2892 domain-containing protein [Herminiimonas sp. NPDC097707]|uniref:YgaP family membrane protein n=1 Tax=Herminiimonas sp. NPDC097707 TaxID=3364007 RepID=UPI00383A9A30
MNIKYPERIARIIVGLCLLSAIFFLESNWRWIGLIGLIPLITGSIGWCPAYSVLDRLQRAADKTP